METKPPPLPTPVPALNRAFLNEHPEVARWHRANSHRSLSGADNYLRCLRRFCAWAGVGPTDLLARTGKEQADLLEDYVQRELGRHVASTTVKTGVAAVASWLERNDHRLSRKIIVPRRRGRGDPDRDYMPDTDALRRVLASANVRARAIIGIMAFGGQREEVMATYHGEDGLKVRDMVDLRIEDGRPRFERVPCLVRVPDTLSKKDWSYFFFLGPEGCEYLLGWLGSRIARGERLLAETPLFPPTQYGRWATARGRGGHVNTNAIHLSISKAHRAAGFTPRPYVWRKYFANRMSLGEAERHFSIQWRRFVMGHAGDIQARYAQNHTHLPKDFVEAMRTGYAKAVQVLETRTAVPDDSEARALDALLLAAGYTKDAAADILAHAKGSQDIATAIAQGPQGLLATPQAPSAAPVVTVLRSKVASEAEMLDLLDRGWTIAAQKPDGTYVIRPPSATKELRR